MSGLRMSSPADQPGTISRTRWAKIAPRAGSPDVAVGPTGGGDGLVGGRLEPGDRNGLDARADRGDASGRARPSSTVAPSGAVAGSGGAATEVAGGPPVRIDARSSATLVDRGQPVAVLRQPTADGIEVAIADQPGDRADLTRTDRPGGRPR